MQRGKTECTKTELPQDLWKIFKRCNKFIRNWDIKRKKKGENGKEIFEMLMIEDFLKLMKDTVL